jgi:uncharacterized protein involved in exopolysaccharide biosynthesis
MLQKQTFQESDISSSREQGATADLGHFLKASYYIEVLQRRALAFAAPFALVLALGLPIIATRPAIYLVEGKILVEAPQIPSDFVRPTVTALANERIQSIEQRVMTRDHLLTMADKFNVLGSAQGSLSDSDIATFMRARTKINVTDVATRTYERQTIAFTVGFEHEQPAIALRVANELITMILNEDIRTRTDSASETTRFLEQETLKLESELSAIELQIAEFKRRNSDPATHAAQSVETQLAALKAELAQKTSIYSDTHPDVKALKQKIAAMETTIAPASPPDAGIDALERQQASLQKILESANQKLAAARLGESLERGQRFERLEVIEQPTLPNAPARPNRPKLFIILVGLALAAGAGVVFVLESRDDTIRRISDLLPLVGPQLVVGIPLIETKAEASRRRRKAVLLTGLVLATILAGSVLAALFLPIDKLLAAALAAFQTG